jgi:hypothetical protein
LNSKIGSIEEPIDEVDEEHRTSGSYFKNSKISEVEESKKLPIQIVNDDGISPVR